MLISDIPALAAHHVPNRSAIALGEHSLTYAELRNRCWRLANALIPLTDRGDRVAVLAENCVEYAECYYGVPGAALSLVLLNYRLAPRELLYILRDSEPRILFVERKYLPAINAIRDDLPFLERLFVIGDEGEGGGEGEALYEDLVADGKAEEPTRGPAETDLCWLIYTSGTTGRPKGAMLSHRNLAASAVNGMCSMPGSSEDVAMFIFPMFHAAGHLMLIDHLRNASVVLLRSFDIETLLQTIQDRGITWTAFAPTMVAMLLEDPRAKQYDLSSLRRILYGAAAMPPEVLRRALELWPGVGFMTNYGMTELSGAVMLLQPSDHERAAREGLGILASAGRQMPFARVRIVDEEGRDVPVGTAGEIIVKGDQVQLGYWRNPEASHASCPDGWFRTGDVGRWDEEGYLYIVDRKKDMILTGGENVYPKEVEEVLHEHPAVVEAAVIGAPDRLWGESVVAVIHARHEVSEAEIIGFCRERLAGYKKPRRVIFLDELPKNASGKIVKGELRALLAEGEAAQAAG